MYFFKPSQFVIFGGISTEDGQGEDRPKIFGDFHMLDLNENFFSMPFTANIRHFARYGHSCSSNLNLLDCNVQEKDDIFMHELIILGGLEF